jgi:hypothetical protein
MLHRLLRPVVFAGFEFLPRSLCFGPAWEQRVERSGVEQHAVIDAENVAAISNGLEAVGEFANVFRRFEKLIEFISGSPVGRGERAKRSDLALDEATLVVG